MEQRLCPQCDSPCEVEATVCKNCGATLTSGSPAAEQLLPAGGELPVAAPNPPANPSPPPAQDMAAVAYQQPYQQPIQQQPIQVSLQQPIQQQPYQQPIQQQPIQQPYQQPYPQNTQYPYAQGPVQQVNVVMANNAPAIMLVKQKSVGVALLLTFLFGPLGMFYSTISGAIIMLIVSVVLAVFTLGFSIFITWPICMLWGAIAADSYNKTLVTRT